MAGSGSSQVAVGKAETFPAPAHGTVEGVLAKASGDWPQHERTTRPKIPDERGEACLAHYQIRMRHVSPHSAHLPTLRGPGHRTLPRVLNREAPRWTNRRRGPRRTFAPPIGGATEGIGAVLAPSCPQWCAP